METGITIITFVFLAAMAFIGYHKGFVRIVLSFVAVALSLTAAYCITPVLTNSLKETKVYDSVKEPVYQFVDEGLASKWPTVGLDNVEIGIDAEQVDDMLAELGLPETLTNAVSETIEDNLSTAALTRGMTNADSETVEDNQVVEIRREYFSDLVADALAGWVLYAAVFACVFIAVMLLLRIVIGVCNIVSKLPVLNSFNHLLGLALGLAEGLMILWIICLVLTATSSTDTGNEMLQAVLSNPGTRYIYTHNPLGNFIR
jgi:uncharacterized membrane protein required for colicin V production